MANGQNSSSLVISYLTLRKMVGVLGTLLPFTLFFGALWIFGTGIQSSMSSYYHTGMGDVFVGTMCVIGFFLFSYKGYERKDDLAGDLACAFAVGLALFPTAPDGPVSDLAKMIGTIHLIFAAAFFSVLIYFCFALFTKTKQAGSESAKKLQRNRVYRFCGTVMAVCILAIVLFKVLPGSVLGPIKTAPYVFWFESIAVFAFGFSWLVKGEAILADK